MAEKDLRKNIYLFYGEDSYSSNQKLNFWKEQFIKKYGEEGNIEVFDKRNLEVKRFETNIQTVPFLCDKRLIVIKDFLANGKPEEQKKVAKAIEKTPDFCIIVFHENKKVEKTKMLFKRIKKHGTIEDFQKLSPQKLTQWVLNKAKTEDIKISPQTANYLSLHCGLELWKISNELEKLKLFANNEEITQKMVDEFVTPSLSASIFKLTDSITGKNTKESLKTLHLLKETGEELTRVFFMIVRHFRILIQVAEMANKGENQMSITKKLKQHPFVIQKTLSQSRNFTPEKLEEIYKNLLKIDKGFKTGEIKIQQGDDSEYSLAIEKLIINCCR